MAPKCACKACASVDLPAPGAPTKPSKTRRPLASNAWDMADELPRHLEDAIALLRACAPVRDLLGTQFVDAFCAVKELEFGTYNRVISSWEREHLLLLV